MKRRSPPKPFRRPWAYLAEYEKDKVLVQLPLAADRRQAEEAAQRLLKELEPMKIVARVTVINLNEIL